MTRTVLVTGSAKGIGASIIKELAKYDYNLVINYNNSEKEAYELYNEIKSLYNKEALVIKCDISKRCEVDSMLNTIYSKFNNIDILVNNAAIDLSGYKKDSDCFSKTMDVNVISTYNLSKLIAPKMVSNGFGRIINISSTNGINTYYPLSAEYDASKAALISITHNLALEYSPIVNVNAIAPGFIGTENELKDWDEYIIKEETKKIMKNRYGKPEEVAHLVKFLISDEADFINNSVIRIDGGQYGS